MDNLTERNRFCVKNNVAFDVYDATVILLQIKHANKKWAISITKKCIAPRSKMSILKKII